MPRCSLKGASIFHAEGSAYDRAVRGALGPRVRPVTSGQALARARAVMPAQLTDPSLQKSGRAALGTECAKACVMPSPCIPEAQLMRLASGHIVQPRVAFMWSR